MLSNSVTIIGVTWLNPVERGLACENIQELSDEYKKNCSKIETYLLWFWI